MHAVDCNFVVINIFIVLPNKKHNPQSLVQQKMASIQSSLVSFFIFFLISLDSFGFQIKGKQKILTIFKQFPDWILQDYNHPLIHLHKHMENYYHIKPPKKPNVLVISLQKNCKISKLNIYTII